MISRGTIVYSHSLQIITPYAESKIRRSRLWVLVNEEDIAICVA